jgi:hypothetical protein
VAAKLTETRIDHDGHPLPPGVYALARADGAIVGYKVRWREDGGDGVRRNAAKRISVRKLGSLERARAEATAYRQAAIEIARRGELVLRPDSAARMTVATPTTSARDTRPSRTPAPRSSRSARARSSAGRWRS